MTATIIPGKEMTLSGKTLVIAPLNFAALKQYGSQVKSVFDGGLPDYDLVAKLTLASLKRNYPDMTADEVNDILDTDNYLEVWEVVMNFSGLVKQAGNMMRRVQAQMAEAGLQMSSPTS